MRVRLLVGLWFIFAATGNAHATVEDTSEPILETTLGVGLTLSNWVLALANVIESAGDGSRTWGALGIAVGSVTLMVEATSASAYDRSTTVEVSAALAIVSGVVSLWRDATSPDRAAGASLAPAAVHGSPGFVLRVSF